MTKKFAIEKLLALSPGVDSNSPLEDRIAAAKKAMTYLGITKADLLNLKQHNIKGDV